MRKFFRDIFTEDDGTTYCAARFCVIAGVLAFIGAAFLHLQHGNPINLNEFGQGFGTLLGGGGILIGGKAYTQKDAK